MKNSRALSTLIIGLALSVSTACSSDQAPMAPATLDADSAGVTADVGAPSANLLNGLIGGLTGTVDGVISTTTGGLISCNVKQTTYGAEWIGPSGGVVKVGPHALVIPQGALKSYTRIRGTAPKGNTVLVDFEPHGLRFARSTALSLSYKDCGLTGTLLGGLLLDVVYVDDDKSILEVLPSLNDLLNQRVIGRVDHFSGYALADRKGSTTDDATLSHESF